MNHARLRKRLVRWDRYGARSVGANPTTAYYVYPAHRRLITRNARYRIAKIYLAWEREHGPDWIDKVDWSDNAEGVELR